MKPGDACTSCAGILIDHDGLAHCPRCHEINGVAIELLRHETWRRIAGISDTRTLQGEPGAEVREASWKVDVKELGERFMKEGIPRG